MLRWEHVLSLLREEDPDKQLAKEAMVLLRNMMHG